MLSEMQRRLRLESEEKEKKQVFSFDYIDENGDSYYSVYEDLCYKFLTKGY